MVALAILLVVSRVMWGFVVPAFVDVWSGTLPLLSYVDSILEFLLAAGIVVAIGRADVVPGRWRWAPAWALAAVVVAWLLAELLPLAAQGSTAVIIATAAVSGLVISLATLFLGVVAIVLAVMSRSAISGTPRGPGSRDDLWVGG